jgi:hypothetical protein
MEIGCEDVEWIQLAQDRVQLHTFGLCSMVLGRHETPFL